MCTYDAISSQTDHIKTIDQTKSTEMIPVKPFTKSWADPEGARARPLKNHKNIRIHSNTSPDLKKSQSYQASIQFGAIIDMAAKRHLNGVSLAGR